MDILRERNVEFDVIEYIKTPPTEEELRGFLGKLNVEPTELFHPGSFEKLCRSLDEFDTFDKAIDLIVEHPRVMNRPVCVRGDRAVIARPAELIEQILD
jgi:arsenate reductase